MFDLRTDQTNGSWIRVDPALAGTLERASGAIARLDQALDGHVDLPCALQFVPLEFSGSVTFSLTCRAAHFRMRR